MPDAASAAAPATAPAAPDADTRLLARQIQDCMTTGVARQVLLLRLSRLPPSQAKPLHLRLARAAMEPLLQLSRARLFGLVNEDLVVVWRGAAEPALSEALRGLAHLLVEGLQGVRSVAGLAESAALPRDGAGLLRLLETSVAAPPPAAPQEARAARRLDPEALTRLEESLARADVASFVRRKRVCETDGGEMTLAWEKRSLRVRDLVAELEPEHEAKEDPWLFRRLTRTLDRRMLSLLSSLTELRGAGPFALNINAASILSSGFLRFDDVLPAHLRGEVVLELLAGDILADPALFRFARNFARGRGYRLLLRGINVAFLPVFSLNQVEMDYLRLDWSPSLQREGSRAAITSAAGHGAVVLAGADTLDAMDWGWNAGIRLFQGRMVQT